MAGGFEGAHEKPAPADYCALCHELAQRSTPLTPEELATFNAMRAREMAKAEARRQPSPQLELAA